MAGKMKSSTGSYDNKWTPEESFCSEGLGVEGEGRIADLKFHTVTAQDRVERFIAITLEIKVAYMVALDKYGVEKSLDPSEYKTSDRILSHDRLQSLIGVPAGLASNDDDSVHPGKQGYFELWDSATSNARKLSVDEEIKFRTNGNSFFIKSFFLTKMGSFQGVDGGQVMSEMSGIASKTNIDKLEQDEMEGCDSDEWGDDD
eukprot:m.96346 g.96346  ORF g.96346 m.96346 type:complete len:202 (+) comp16651_c0_seq1:102-707(+)